MVVWGWNGGGTPFPCQSSLGHFWPTHPRTHDPPLTHTRRVQELKTFSLTELHKASSFLQANGLESRLSISIKKLLYITEMASQDVDKMDKFISLLTQEGTFPAK
jgi:hypothetical protein